MAYIHEAFVLSDAERRTGWLRSKLKPAAYLKAAPIRLQTIDCFPPPTSFLDPLWTVTGKLFENLGVSSGRSHPDSRIDEMPGFTQVCGIHGQSLPFWATSDVERCLCENLYNGSSNQPVASALPVRAAKYHSQPIPLVRNFGTMIFDIVSNGQTVGG